MLAWHFLGNDKKLNYGDGRKVRTGVAYRHKGKVVVVGRSGLHASTDILEALENSSALESLSKYDKDTILCRVELDGAISLRQQNKKSNLSGTLYAGSSRKVLWMVNTENIMAQFFHKYFLRVIDDLNDKDTIKNIIDYAMAYKNKEISWRKYHGERHNKFLDYVASDAYLIHLIARHIINSRYFLAIRIIRDIKIKHGIPKDVTKSEHDKLYKDLSNIENSYLRKSLVGMVNASRHK